ncbi:hypothetical protein [Streptomyces huiliensis]|uniref:hypothetical protein n=1 Tax=Streptomyces huiliensis TaxID=2876027 RepID=UPI001CBA7ED0|nr:hypothetical protein [Streptomyces huiliensis]MBZ4319470.1 hypothetical protein [Streptomyces huiliensis]
MNDTAADDGTPCPAPGVRTRTVGSTLVVTIDRPRARNAVNAAVARGIAAAVDRLTPDGGALPAALELAEEIAANAPLAPAAVKRTVRRADGTPEREAFAAQAAELDALLRSADFAEGARARTGSR